MENLLQVQYFMQMLGSISWGTPGTYKAAGVEEPKIGYDASVDKLVITYDLSADSSGYCLVASLSGGSFSTSSTHVQYRSGGGEVQMQLSIMNTLNKL